MRLLETGASVSILTELGVFSLGPWEELLMAQQILKNAGHD
jgi:hypothetical protein